MTTPGADGSPVMPEQPRPLTPTELRALDIAPLPPIEDTRIEDLSEEEERAFLDAITSA